jgi:transcription elongation factor Elf1
VESDALLRRRSQAAGERKTVSRLPNIFRTIHCGRAKIVIGDIDLAGAQETAQQIKSAGGSVYPSVQ